MALPASRRLQVLCASVVAFMAATGGASAQDVAEETTELPPVVVETAEQAKKRKKPAQVTDTRLLDVDAGTDGAGGGTGVTGGGGVAVAGGGGITGASTSVITREQIERAPQASVADIIAREAGVQSRSLYGGVNGAGTTVDLRGFGATASSNTLVLIDGRRLNDWDGAGFDLSTIAKDSIERIEITRGNSGAVLYGDGAVGGVINIVTRGGAGMPNQGRIEGGIGSFQSREGNVSVSGSSGAFSTFINANVFHSDGYRANNELQQQSLLGDFRWTFSQGSVYANFAVDEQELGLPGALGVNNPFLGGGSNQLLEFRRGTNFPHDYGDKKGRRGTVGFTYMLMPDVELIVDGGVRNKQQQAGFFPMFDEAYVDTDLTTRSITPRVSITQPLLGLPSRVLAGVDYYDTDYESFRSQFEGLAPIHVYNGTQQTVAGYWQQTVSILPTTDISAGGRIQWNDTTARDVLDLTAPGAGAWMLEGLPLDDSETNHAWHFGAEHEVISGVTLIGRVAHSFRVANIDERIGSALFGFPTDFNLRTQKSNDWEAGVRLSYGAFNLQSSYYDMRLTDEIQYDASRFLNYNLDPTRRRGVETIASWQLLRDVRLFGNVTYTDARFREGLFAGNEVPLVSRWTGNVGLSWNIIDDALTFDTVVRYVGDRRMEDDNRNFQPLIPSHTTVDVRLGGEIDQFFWSAGVANIFDELYYDYSVASASTYNVYNAYPQPGRTYMIKAGTTW